MERDLIYGLCERYVRDDMIELEPIGSQPYILIGERGKLYGLIPIQYKETMEEKVMAILHEVFHFHPNFISYTGGLSDKTLDRNECLEAQIDEMAHRTYSQRPDIVVFIEGRLAEAYELVKEKLKQEAFLELRPGT